MKATEHLWRTADGLRLVRAGDPDGVTLAYTAGDDVAPVDEARVPADEQESKARESKPTDKQRRPAANKAKG